MLMNMKYLIVLKNLYLAVHLRERHMLKIHTITIPTALQCLIDGKYFGLG